jgi:hypothetical protein
MAWCERKVGSLKVLLELVYNLEIGLDVEVWVIQKKKKKKIQSLVDPATYQVIAPYLAMPILKGRDQSLVLSPRKNSL